MASSRQGLCSADSKIELEEENGRQVPKIDPRALEIFGIKENEGKEPTSGYTEPNPNTELPKEGNKRNDFHPLYSDQTPPAAPRQIIDRKLVGERRDPGSEWRLLDRAHGDLTLFRTPQGVVALHARAAYERVRFEQLEDSLRDSTRTSSQSLLLPEPLEFDGIDRANLEASLLQLRQLGFVLEEFGRNFYRLEGCPHWLDPSRAAAYLQDFLEIARDNGGALQVESFVRQALERQANYRHENKEVFSDEELIDLVDQLLRCRNPYVCPRGRPVYFEIPVRDFETRFKRKL
jgi:DNA mismatch repair protein MutL